MNSLEYHNSTKHTPDSVRRAARPLDWANMPDSFRNYEGAPLIDLPADPPSPAVAALEVLRGSPCPLTTGDPIAFLSQLLFYSAAISAAKKTQSGDRYALRVNPSSGNLHPTEFHFASPGGRFHYRVSAHMLERRARGDAGPLCFLLTTIVWREAWKYGSRAYRYCLLDAGHAWQALALAARAIGCEASATGRFADEEVAAAYALSPDEWPLLLVHVPHAPVLAPGGERIWAGGVPNRLSEQAVSYPSIELAHAAAKVSLDAPDRLAAPLAPSSASVASPGTGPSFGEVVRRRRSALDFRAAGSMSQQQLSVLLDLATRPLAADFSSPSFIELYVYVHRVSGVAPGLYRHVRAENRLELLQLGDQRVIAAALSLGQDLAGNACIAFSMIADLPGAIARFGDRGYRYVHFEAGAIGQRLYVAAVALGLQSTGIGAFYDDLVHQHLGLRPEQGQVVYHFACGHAVPDDRLTVTADDLAKLP